MLGETHNSSQGLAWLVDPACAKAIRVHARAIAAQSGGISFFSPDFALSSAEPWLVGDRCELPELETRPFPGVIHRVESSSADFERLHEEILAAINAGRFEKVVPVICEELEFAEPVQLAMFANRFHAPAYQFAYGLEYDGEGLCGITPELLFEVKNGVLETMALAGTAPATGPSLLDNPKERLEHELVVENLLAILKPMGAPEVGATEERTYGILKHLYTPLKLELNEAVDFMELVVKFHPTAALGGWPRQAAVDWLQQQSFHQARGRFGAPFGFVDGEHMRCVVAIRCVQWSGARAQISTGCGVVKQSRPLNEWQELHLKRQSVYRQLGMDLG